MSLYVKTKKAIVIAAILIAIVPVIALFFPWFTCQRRDIYGEKVQYYGNVIELFNHIPGNGSQFLMALGLIAYGIAFGAGFFFFGLALFKQEKVYGEIDKRIIYGFALLIGAYLAYGATFTAAMNLIQLAVSGGMILLSSVALAIQIKVLS